MARSGKTKKRIVEPDATYQSRLITRLINRVMKDGKKTVAQKVVYGTMDVLKTKGMDPLQLLETAINNVGPRLEVHPRRIGGASYQVPTEVRGDRKVALAIRWIIEAAKKRPSKDYHKFENKLAAELVDSSNNTGLAIKKKEDTQKMAEANRAFAHFRW